MQEQLSIVENMGAGVLIPEKKPKKQQRKISEYQQDFDSVQEDIEFRDPDKYKKEFVAYLKRTQELTFNIIGEDINLILPYKHRWAKCYRKGVLSKFISLGIWAKRHKLSCGMLSLTAAHTGFTDFEILENFRNAWDKFHKTLSVMKYQYIFLFEPHTNSTIGGNGIPHIHVLIFGNCSEKDMKRLEDLWVSKYNMNLGIVDKKGQQHAFQFEAGLKENINSIVNYLMKYMSKTIVSDIENNEALIRFHSLFFQTGARLFTSSRYLSFVMKRHRTSIKPVQAIFCNENEIYNKSTSKSFPCKYQQIDGVRYKYELLPFEIKSKKERKYEFIPFDVYFMKNTSLWFDMINYI